MPLLDDARRWMKDRLTTDEMIHGTPKQHMAMLEDHLVNLTPAERLKEIDRLKAYTTYYYQGHHNESTPADFRQQMRTMDQRVERLNAVDAARETLQKYGGPPSRETIAESLDRSFREREKQAERKSEAIRPEGESERESVGIRMRV